MLFAVRHLTHYRYSLPIVPAPHLLRLTPRPEYALLSRTLVVRPEPVDVRTEVDIYGNLGTRVVFPEAATEELVIESRFEVDTTSLAEPGFSMLRTPPAADVLASYQGGGAWIDEGVAAFARAVRAEVAGQDLLPFLDHLCRAIHGRADKHVRPTGEAQSAAETLATWRGACRDFTVLFIDMARSLGLAARFCSGYQAKAETPDGRSYLHAWPEVFVPSIGWRGWDPTHGIPVTDGHVALCAAPTQADTMPVVGSYSFSGTLLTSTLDFDLRIRTS